MMSAKFWLEIKRLSVGRQVTARERESERENDYDKENSKSFLNIFYHLTVFWFKNVKINFIKKISVLSVVLFNKSTSDFKPI